MEEIIVSVILKCPECEDRDCQLNVEGICHNIDTILHEIPSGMYTCSNAQINFKDEKTTISSLIM